MSTLMSDETTTDLYGIKRYTVNVYPGSQGKSPVDSTPWLPLRFNTVDGEAYGRGRVGQFIGDLKSLEALSQAIVEGSAAAAKVVFTVSPSLYNQTTDASSSWQRCYCTG